VRTHHVLWEKNECGHFENKTPAMKVSAGLLQLERKSTKFMTNIASIKPLKPKLQKNKL